MGRGILRGAGGDENLKSNFIWPKGLLCLCEAVELIISYIQTRLFKDKGTVPLLNVMHWK